MRAAVTTGVGMIETVDVAEPEPSEDELVVQVSAVGLCGSDIHFFLGTDPYASFPRVLGHEFSGTVVAMPGPETPGGAHVGDLVAVEPLLPCGVCYACRRGLTNCCMHLKVLGVHLDGALTERISVRRSAAHIANGLTPELAALVEPLSIGVHACRRAGISSSDRVVVFGAGPIGQAVIIAADRRGARVLAVDRVGSRLALARRLGAEATVDAGEGGIGEAIDDWTDGDGADVVVEATGAPAVFPSCVAAAAHGARLLVIGTPSSDVLFPALEVTRKELNILGSRNNVDCFPEALEIVRAAPDTVGRLVTHRFGLSQVGEALGFAAAHPEETEKVIISVS